MALDIGEPVQTFVGADRNRGNFGASAHGLDVALAEAQRREHVVGVFTEMRGRTGDRAFGAAERHLVRISLTAGEPARRLTEQPGTHDAVVASDGHWVQLSAFLMVTIFAAVLAGDDPVYLPILAVGGAGIISATISSMCRKPT